MNATRREALKPETMIEWNIQSRAHACQSCRKPFVDKQPMHTLLFDQKHAYERLDVCDDCWANQFREGAADRKGFVSYWHAVYMAPVAAVADPIQKETAETLLRKLIEQNDPVHLPARYILAAMLERKRIFKVKGQVVKDQQRIFLYEHSKTGDLFQIPDPNLRLDQLEEVQRDVAQLLEVGLPNPSATPENNISPEDAPPAESVGASPGVAASAALPLE